MSNPRIVKGHNGESVGVRGHVGETVFSIAVPTAVAAAYDRIALEDRLLQEAESLIHRAGSGEYDWSANGFLANEFGGWQQTLTEEETKTLMG